jgi:hypothetical protein
MRLTEQQRAALLQRLKGQKACRVEIVHMLQDLNSHKLAYDLYGVLLAAGWPAGEPYPMDLLACDDVQVGVADYLNPPQGALVLLAALMAVGIRTPSDLVRSHTAAKGGCCLMVGSGDEWQGKSR